MAAQCSRRRPRQRELIDVRVDVNISEKNTKKWLDVTAVVGVVTNNTSRAVKNL